MSEYRPVKVGRGSKVHAGLLYDTVKRGRFTDEIYRHLCGAGNSTAAHNWRAATVRALASGTPITCTKCLGMIQARGESNESI